MVYDNERKRVVVYTAIFGGYDNVVEHVPQENVLVDYVVYTDDGGIKTPPGYIVHVATKRSDLTNLLRNFYYRLNAFEHKELDAYDLIVYVDGNCHISDPGFLHSLATSTEVLRHGLTMSTHPQRDCAYAEGSFSISHNAKYDRPGIERQAMDYRNEGLPERAGLWWTGLMVYNRTATISDDERLALCNLATTCMEHGVEYNETPGRVPQGQVIFSYAAWKHNACFHTLPIQHYKTIKYRPHNLVRAPE